MSQIHPPSIQYVAELRGEIVRLPTRLNASHFFLWVMVLHVLVAFSLYSGLAYWWQVGTEPDDKFSLYFQWAWFFVFSMTGGVGWAMICEVVMNRLPVRRLGRDGRETLSLLITGPALALCADGLCMLPLIDSQFSRVIVGLEVVALKGIALFLVSWRLSRVKGTFTIDPRTVQFRPNWRLYPR